MRNVSPFESGGIPYLLKHTAPAGNVDPGDAHMEDGRMAITVEKFSEMKRDIVTFEIVTNCI